METTSFEDIKKWAQSSGSQPLLWGPQLLLEHSSSASQIKPNSKPIVGLFFKIRKMFFNLSVGATQALIGF